MMYRCLSLDMRLSIQGFRLNNAVFAYILWFITLIGAPSAWAAAAANDSFYSSKLITGGSGTVTGNNTDATQEVDEPAHAGNPGGASLWYTWHCSSGGTFDLRVTDATFGYALAVYVGKTLETLTPIASAPNSSVSFDLSPGTVYRIAVDGLDAAKGSFSLRWKQTFGPSGGPDLVSPERLINIKVVEENFSGSDCEVEERCLVAGKRRLLRFDMHTHNLGNEDLVFGSPEDSPMFVYSSCHSHYHFEALAAYRVLTLSNDLVRLGNKFGFCLEDVLNVSAPAGTQRRFTCDDQGIQAGFGDIYNADLPCQYVDVTGLASGDYILEIELDPLHQIAEANEDNNLVRVQFSLGDRCASRPANDDFLSPEILSGPIATTVGDNTCATKQDGEPRHNPSSPASKSIWYSWTAPAAGPVAMSTAGSAFDTVVSVYTGRSLTGLGGTRIAAGEDIDPFTHQDRLTFNATEGTTYFIAVDGINIGAGAQGGSVVLNINPSANDAFDNCQPLSGADGSVLGTVSEAFNEQGEPLHAGQPGGSSLWYCWTASSTGIFSWDTVGSSIDTLLAVYTGNEISTLTPVASDDDSGGRGTSRLSFAASSGTAYKIAVDRKYGTNAPASSQVVQLNWHGASFMQSPIIVEQPHSIATFISSNATLTVSASGAAPLTYQWFHGGLPVMDADNVSGAITATLQINAIKESDRGIYQVQISNAFGTNTSVNVNLVAASRSRVLYVDPMVIVPGTDVPMTVSIAAKGSEHALQFSIYYDPAKLSDPQVQAGPDLPAGSQLTADLSQATLGKIGFHIVLPSAGVLPSGDSSVVVCWLQASPLIGQEQRVPVCFDDLPVARLVSGVDGGPLATLYACGTLTGGARDFLSIAAAPNGTLQITLQGMPGVTYEFQYSTDLKIWSTLTTQFSQTSVVQVVDGADHASNAVFYRTIRK